MSQSSVRVAVKAGFFFKPETIVLYACLFTLISSLGCFGGQPWPWADGARVVVDAGRAVCDVGRPGGSDAKPPRGASMPSAAGVAVRFGAAL